jgi:ankyrin repeat protein
MSGSFKPIDVGEWSGQVYIGETQHFFAAIAAHDGEGVSRLIEKGVDVNRRDHVGRTALHVAILIKASEIACILINAGARMSARLVDGRSALHLAAQLDQPSVVQKLLERSALNQEQANATKQQDAEYVELVDPKADERLSSEDDWSSEDDDVVDIVADDDEDHDNNGERNSKHEEDEEDDDGKQENKKATSAEVSTDAEDFLEEDGQPDILDVNLPDWDLGFTPLAHAVMSGSLPIIEVLLSAQADPKRLNATRDTAFHPLTLTILRKNEDEACKILERLILAGASTSTADDKMRTIFHRALVEDKLQLVSTILRCDPNAQLVLNFPSFSWHAAHFPIFSVIEHSKYAMLALILAHGAKVKFSEEDITKALDAWQVNFTIFQDSVSTNGMNISPVDKRHNFFGYGTTNVMNQVFPPVETAIARRDDVAQLLIALGAEVDVGCKNAYQDHMGPAVRKTIFDWVRFANGALYQQIKTKWEELDALSTDAVVVEGAITTWKAYLADKQTKLTNSQRKTEKNRSQALQDDIAKLEEARCYVLDINEALVARNAKSWNEMYSDNPFSGDATGYAQYSGAAVQYRDPPTTYDITSLYSSQRAPLHQAAMYDELFEACFTGNNDKVQQLCLPVEGKHENSQPLNIFVQVADPSNRYDQTGTPSGFLPLRVS